MEPGSPLQTLQGQADLLGRIADALERLAPPARAAPALDAAEAFVWAAERGMLAPVARVNRVDLSHVRL